MGAVHETYPAASRRILRAVMPGALASAGFGMRADQNAGLAVDFLGADQHFAKQSVGLQGAGLVAMGQRRIAAHLVDHQNIARFGGRQTRVVLVVFRQMQRTNPRLCDASAGHQSTVIQRMRGQQGLQVGRDRWIIIHAAAIQQQTHRRLFSCSARRQRADERVLDPPERRAAPLRQGFGPVGARAVPPGQDRIPRLGQTEARARSGEFKDPAYAPRLP